MIVWLCPFVVSVRGGRQTVKTFTCAWPGVSLRTTNR